MSPTEIVSNRNVDIVRRCYQAFNEADIATLDAHYAEDVTWTTPGSSPVAGTARGKGAVFAQYGRYGEASGGTFRAELDEVFEAPDGRVVGLHRNTGERNGTSLDTACCIVFTLEDGLLTSGTEFFFDQTLWDQFWA